MQQELCTTCEAPMSWMPLNERHTCSNGLRCERLFKRFGERLTYQSELAIFPPSNLDIVEHLIDVRYVDKLDNIYTFDYLTLLQDGVITQEEYNYITGKITDVLTNSTFSDFINAMNIPLVDVECSNVKTSLVDISSYTTPDELNMALGYILTSWETNYGKYIEEGNDVKHTEMTLYKLMPFGTKMQVHNLAKLFVSNWLNKSPSQNV